MEVYLYLCKDSIYKYWDSHGDTCVDTIKNNKR